MKKALVIIVVLVIAVLLVTSTTVEAGGGQVQGTKGEGEVNQNLNVKNTSNSTNSLAETCDSIPCTFSPQPND